MTIVVGTDTSAAADLAVADAAQLAAARGTELVLLYVQPEGKTHSAVDPDRAVDPARHLGQLASRYPGLITRTRVESGDPAERIVAVAEQENADTIVVGNRGAHGSWWRVRDSVPTIVVRHAPCSVLIVDTRKAQ